MPLHLYPYKWGPFAFKCAPQFIQTKPFYSKVCICTFNLLSSQTFLHSNKPSYSQIRLCTLNPLKSHPLEKKWTLSLSNLPLHPQFTHISQMCLCTPNPFKSYPLELIQVFLLSDLPLHPQFTHIPSFIFNYAFALSIHSSLILLSHLAPNHTFALSTPQIKYSSTFMYICTFKWLKSDPLQFKRAFAPSNHSN